jgi:transcriptional regulator with XRE-family HTH domain
VSPGPQRTPLALRLRELRTRNWPRQLTQAALARLLHVAETTVSSYETGQAAPGDDKLRAYATVFVRPRLLPNGHPHVPTEDQLSPDERTARDALFAELRQLRDRHLAHEFPRRRTWQFPDETPVRLVSGRIPAADASKLAAPDHQNFTRLLGHADLDAMVELYGHLRAENPGSDVRYMLPDEMSDADLSGHVVVVGGLGWAEATESFLGVLDDHPVRQVTSPDFSDGEIFVVDPPDGGEPVRYEPQYRAQLNKDALFRYVADVGYFARMPNPYNLSATLTICSGVHSRGVHGAVRMLTHAGLRERNEEYLARRFGTASQYGLLFRVPVNSRRIVTPEISNRETRLFEWHQD